MHNLVLSPIDPEKLINSISEKVTANILKELKNHKIECQIVFTPKFRKTPSLSKSVISDYDFAKGITDEEIYRDEWK
jgi:hypothetical protein